MNTVPERFIAFAQFSLSLVWMVGYFVILGLLITGEISVSDGLRDAIIALLGALTINLAQIIAYWFQRQRTNGGTPSAPES